MGEQEGQVFFLPVDLKCRDMARVLLPSSCSLFANSVPISSAGECGHLWVGLVTEGGLGHRRWLIQPHLGHRHCKGTERNVKRMASHCTGEWGCGAELGGSFIHPGEVCPHLCREWGG